MKLWPDFKNNFSADIYNFYTYAVICKESENILKHEKHYESEKVSLSKIKSNS